MEAYRVNIDSESYFEVDSILLQKDKRVVNLRSVKGHIGNNFNFMHDEKLKAIVMNYQTTTDNVELLNILSREYNGWNWFEAYDESYNVNREVTKDELMDPSRIANSSHPTPVGCDQIVDIRRFMSEVRQKDGKHLSSNALKEHLHAGIRVEVPINLSEINYIPMWHINGAAQARADTCALYCPFEVLIHVLAKRFVDFKAKLLQLASTDIQLAKAENRTLERYMHLSQIQLIRKIEQLEAENKGITKERDDISSKFDDLNAKFDAFRDEANARDQQAQAERQHLIDEVHHANNELAHANNELAQAHEERAQLQESLNTAHSKLDNATELITDLKDCVETGIAVAQARMEAAAKTVREEFTTYNVTTNSRIETIDVWSIRRLNTAYHRSHIAHDDEEALDLFCGDADHPERINGHQYKPEENDVKIRSFSNANALDLADFLKANANQYPNIRFYTPKRKLIVKLGHRDEVIQALTAYSNSGDGRIEETIDRFKRQSFDIVRGTMDVLQAILDKENANEEDKPQAIARVQEKLEAQNQRLQASQKTNAQLMEELRPGKWLFWHNRAYRQPRAEDDGSVTCPVLKASTQRYTLSEHDIRHGRFKRV